MKINYTLFGVCIIIALCGVIYFSSTRKNHASTVNNVTVVRAKIGTVTSVPTDIPYQEVRNNSNVWKQYAFTPYGISFQYPPGWILIIQNSNHEPYLTIANDKAMHGPVHEGYDPTIDQGKYAINISGFNKINYSWQRASTLSELEKKLSQDNAYIASRVSQTEANVNGYKALLVNENSLDLGGRPYGPPGQAAYILDGKGKVVLIEAWMDTMGTKSYFDQLLNSFNFTK